MGISINTLILIQDIQLLCFTLVFGILALQQWSNATRRWVLYSFLANCAGSIIDLYPGHLHNLIRHAIEPMTFPLSYALLNVAFVHFERRAKLAIWASAGVLLLSLPAFVAWSSSMAPVWTDSLGDLMIGIECAITPAILLSGSERSTRAPRVLMSMFLVPFALLEFARAWVFFGMHQLPDSTFPSLVLISAVAYIVNVSLLPLAVIWMMNARLESELQQQIVVDELTNVYNRRGLRPALDRELAHYRRYREDFSLIVLDLDHFKELNDAFGHAAGDAALISVAEFLHRRLRDTDVLARIGGEEFLILLPHTTLAAAQFTVEQLCKGLREKKHMFSGTPVQVTASWGITNTSGSTNTSAQELFRQADFALYRAKNAGRDRVCTFSPDDQIGEYRISQSELYSI